MVVGPDQAATAVAVSPTLYEQLDVRFDRFRQHWLVAAQGFGGDWPTWEIQPEGDAIVMLLEGGTTLVMEGDDGEQALDLHTRGQYAVVPRNTCHSARTATSSRMLFITPDEGTENRPVEPGHA